ncbi:MAG: alpha/beta fold hydrolase, partial [Calditrichaeota bacterium]
MPVIQKSNFHPPVILRNGHIQTIYPSLFRKVYGVQYQRERLETPDGDFLDLDWSIKGNKRLVILSHGLEGNTYRAYMLGMVKALNTAGWDALAWNFRGCSGEPNRLVRSYHSGDTDDLETVIHHAQAKRQWDQIALIGFSMGGNITLKYLGEREKNHPKEIAGVVTLSVPVDLESSAYQLARGVNRIYMIRFLRMLRKKIQIKSQLFPDLISLDGFEQIKSFKEFDDRYTAPIHGFKDAKDYWTQSSSKQFIPSITVPTLLINAKNDPFLSPECYPIHEAE